MPLASSESQLNSIVKRWKDHCILKQDAHFRTTSHSRWQTYAENPQYILNVHFFKLLLVLPDDKWLEISAHTHVQPAAAKHNRFNSANIPSHDVSASAILTKDLDFRRECLQPNKMVVI